MDHWLSVSFSICRNWIGILKYEFNFESDWRVLSFDIICGAYSYLFWSSHDYAILRQSTIFILIQAVFQLLITYGLYISYGFEFFVIPNCPKKEHPYIPMSLFFVYGYTCEHAKFTQ